MSLVDEIRKIPPVTRFICGSLLLVTLPTMLQIASPYKLLFVKELVTTRFEIWRVYTSFFLGGSGINFVFDLAMFYRNSNELESTHYAGRSADYAWQAILAATGIIALNIPLRTYVHTRALLVALTYVSSALAPAGSQSSFFGLITFPVKYLPYTFIAMDFLMAGPQAAAVSITGAIMGHLWWWGVWDTGALRGWGSAPSWLRSLMGERRGVVNMGGVHVVPPRRLREAGNDGARNWGPGRRLGD